MNKRGFTYRLLALLLLAFPVIGWAGTLTPATGGEAIPSETAGNVFTELSGPVYEESSSSDVGTGTIVLQAPPGFEWDTGAPAPVAQVTRLNPGFPGGRNINNLADGGTITASSVTAQQITFQITATSTAQRRNMLTFGNLRVRPLQVSPPALGDIVHTGAANLTNVTAGNTSWGALNQTPLQQNVLLTAQGEYLGPVIIEVGETVNLEAFAFQCSGAGGWRDRWIIDGAQSTDTSGTSACARSPITDSTVFNQPGLYEIEFVSEYCNIFFFGFCFSGWVEHGRDTIEIQVVAEPVDVDPLLEYRMEQPDWPVSPVVDASGNGFDGQPLNGAVTDDVNRAIPGDPGTCRYADLTGDQRIQAPLPAEINNNESFSVAFWLEMPAGEQTLTQPSIFAVGDQMPNQFAERFEIYRNNDNELEVRFVYDSADAEFLTAGGVYDGEWHHVAVTREFEVAGNRTYVTERLYINGALEDERDDEFNPGQSGNAILADAAGAIHLAGFPGPEFPASARMDDVMFFTGALTPTEIRFLRDRVLPCEDSPQALQIDVPATASVCSAANVIVRVVDDSGVVITDYTGTVDLSTTTGRGVWGMGTAGGTLVNVGAADDGQAQYQFVEADNGSVALTLLNQSADDLRVSALDADVGLTATSDIVAFRENGFAIEFSDELGTEIVAQRLHEVRVRAERLDPDTGECGLNENYDGAVDLKAWLARSVDDPGGLAPVWEGVLLPDAQPGGDNVTLGFNAGEAVTTLETDDVGQYRLNLRDDSSGLVVDDDGNPRPVAGESAQATARPFGFAFDGISMDGTANPAETGPGGSVFGAAGREFSSELLAVGWQPANEDPASPGVPDPDAVLAPANPLPSFAWDATVTRSTEAGRFWPDGGDFGVLSGGAVNGGDFASGTVDLTALRFSEVGAIVLEARAGNYLNSGFEVSGRSDVVGRFVPARFDVEIVTQGCGDFTWSDQPIAEVRVTARAAAPASGTTRNYDGTLGYANGVELADADEADPLAGTLSNNTVDNGLFSAGVAELVNDPALLSGVTFTFDAFESLPRELALRATDNDGVSSEAGLEEATEIRSGRLRLVNALGSERRALQVPLVIESYQEFSPDEGAWLAEAGDDCTVLATGDFSLSDQQFVGGAVTAVSDVTLEGDGTGSVELAAPGATGTAILAAGLEDMPWLRHEWQAPGEADDPRARAAFGLREGDPRLLHRRELY